MIKEITKKRIKYKVNNEEKRNRCMGKNKR